ncbi:MAG: hypothetical protein K0Q72_1052 [Armatimonadetes bacterium]|jgi:hypothetical protein|nr:hypothetical protein [Armatimonadota bacterium]
MSHPDQEPEALFAPSAAEVARRALILSAMICRAHLDAAPGDPEARTLHGRIDDWLQRLGLHELLAPEEASILTAPLGGLEARKRIQATWLVEGLAILAWALGRYPLPALAAKVDVYDVTAELGFLAEDAAGLLDQPELRPVEELNACREVLYAVHCRLRDVRRRPERNDFHQWLEPTWLEALGLTPEAVIAAGDLAIDGLPLHRADPARVQEVEAIVYERHRAAIWLAGEEPGFWEVTVDT